MNEFASKRNEIYKKKSDLELRLENLTVMQAHLENGIEFLEGDVPDDIRAQIDSAIERSWSRVEQDRIELWENIGEIHSEAEGLLGDVKEESNNLEGKLVTLKNMEQIPILSSFLKAVTKNVESKYEDLQDLSESVSVVQGELSCMRTKVVKKN